MGLIMSSNMELENIGFYTLSDYRIKQSHAKSPMWRTELIITDKCNFACPYCRGLREACRGDISLRDAKNVLDIWAKNGLKNVRFSGGEPTLHPQLKDIVAYAKYLNVERIAISTNGSNDLEYYKELLSIGVNDLSISLDGCCAADIDYMSGKSNCNYGKNIINNLKELSKLTYVTVGVVITKDNYNKLNDIIMFASNLGVSDIRIISAAQENMLLEAARSIDNSILDKHPILKYRINNIIQNRNVRGIKNSDCTKCHLMKDDCVVAGNKHFPCVIYMREGGKAIGEVNENMRSERQQWLNNHNVYEDKICRNNCLDVCIDYNNRFEELSNNEA